MKPFKSNDFIFNCLLHVPHSPTWLGSTGQHRHEMQWNCSQLSPPCHHSPPVAVESDKLCAVHAGCCKLYLRDYTHKSNVWCDCTKIQKHLNDRQQAISLIGNASNTYGDTRIFTVFKRFCDPVTSILITEKDSESKCSSLLLDLHHQSAATSDSSACDTHRSLRSQSQCLSYRSKARCAVRGRPWCLRLRTSCSSYQTCHSLYWVTAMFSELCHM